ncbi:MAG: hypothetical protein Fues2KO_10880 [Fuerstiella sp.]
MTCFAASSRCRYTGTAIGATRPARAKENPERQSRPGLAPFVVLEPNQANNSSITRPSRTIMTGRPVVVLYSFSWLMPSAW